jgi:hypothetical protein
MPAMLLIPHGHHGHHECQQRQLLQDHQELEGHPRLKWKKYQKAQEGDKEV